MITKSLYATAKDGTPLHWTAYAPAGGSKAPACIVLHVGGFRGGAAGPLSVCQDLATAGFWGLATEYRLASVRNKLAGQVSAGQFPDQTDDVASAIDSARKDSRFNGQVYLVGGSAGASHALHLADLADKVVAMSPASAFAASNYDAKFYSNCVNYVGSSDPTVLATASPVTRLKAMGTLATPVFLIASDHDSMPPEQFTNAQATLKAIRANFQSRLIPGTNHAFKNWNTAKPEILAFLKS